MFSEEEYERDPTVYRQCVVEREGAHMTTWLPEQYAIVGKSLRLRDHHSRQMVAGWKVLSVGARATGDDMLRRDEANKEELDRSRMPRPKRKDRR